MHYRQLLLSFALLLLPALATAQDPGSCRASTDTVYPLMAPPVPGWGYTYDSLLTDLQRWKSSPFVQVDSIGRSVSGRPLWELTITDPGASSTPRRRVYIHARTHPNEVQITWVTNEIIRYLLSEEPYAQTLRERLVFTIVPMYNPDGVELGYNRENANGVDLERGWDKTPMEPEVAALKKRFIELMASEMPIQVALNMHSAVRCERYFVYHDESGTSLDYALREQRFIEGVRSGFINGIQPWNTVITWIENTPTHFPESWWWFNHGSTVMALTYEDMNCESAGKYDSTAYAILQGIADYLNISASVRLADAPSSALEASNYPNPFSGSTTVRYRLPSFSDVSITVRNIVGEKIESLEYLHQSPGDYEFIWRSGDLPTGTYFYTVEAGDYRQTLRLALTR